ncbi:TonB-dependent receptor [Flavobacteriaceae bacterium F08102]|nr:TonB-dependent receptor [Flavobacteriaceae bacterium F08102]
MEFKFKIAFLYFKERLLPIMMRTLMLLCCTLTFGFGPITGLSQNAKIVIDSDRVMSVEHIFELIKTQTDYRFIYRSDVIQSAPDVQLKKGVIKAGKLLDKVLTPISCTFEFTKNNTVIVQRQENDSLLAQETITIKGSIKDEQNEPMVGVNIIIKGTKKGVSSDFDGNYSIKVPKPANDVVLIFSYVGYEKQEITIGNKTTINVQLKADLSGLDEVVVVGYGSMKKKDVTGAVSSLDPIVLKTSTFPTIGSMIQGQLAGVEVLTGTGEPGTPVRIRIRGDATINDGADPLVVVDGVPMPDDFNLNDINPNDVEALDVLKGAAASAIYGSRALAGVLEITTKRGTKYTKPRITYSHTTGIKSLQGELNALNGDQYRAMWDEGLVNYLMSRYNIRDGVDAVKNYGVDPNTGLSIYQRMADRVEFGTENTNWVDLLIGNAISQNDYLSLRGGDVKSQYAFSFGRNTEDGIVVGNKFERNTVSFNYDQKFSEKVKVGFSIVGGSSIRKGGVATISTATTMRPDVKAFNDDGSYYIEFYERTSGPPWAQTIQTRAYDNPLVLAKEVTNDRLSRNVTISPYGEFQLFNDLKLTTRYSYNLSLGKGESYYPSYTDFALFRNAKGYLTDSRYETSSNTFTNYLSYLKVFNDHDISANLGMEYNKRKSQTITQAYKNFADDEVQNALWYAAAEDYLGGNGDEWESTSVGYFARVNYKYKNRYIFSGSLRVDGSSRFAPVNKYGVFPSVALGYIMSDEPFFERFKKTLNLLKFRASTGKTGNDRVGPYSWLAQFQSGVNYFGETGVRPVSLGNDQLKWESSTEYNFGIDYGFFRNNRLRGSIDIYKKDVKDMLVAIPMPPSAGVSSVIQNFGDITNKGVELSLSGVIVQGADFTWDAGINVYKNKNILKRLGVERNSSNSGGNFLSYYLLQEGQPIGLIYGIKTDGLFKSWEEIDEYEALNPDKRYQESFWNTIPGHIKFVDSSGDGYVSLRGNGKDDGEHEDRRIIGNSQADFQGGFYTNLEYKGIRLNVRSTFQKGGDKYWSYGESQFRSSNFTPGNNDALALQRWTPENPNAKYPVFMNDYYTNKVNDFWLFDTSYFKIQEIVLSYDLPRGILENTKVFNRINIFASLNNVATFTKYPGYNVESFSTNPIQGRIQDYSSYPNERLFKLGIKVEF